MKRTLNLALMVAVGLAGATSCSKPAATETKVCTTTSATERIDKDTSAIYTRECGVLKVSDDTQQDGRMMGGARYRLQVDGDRVVKIVDRLGRAAI